jgi:Tfp pilus assembly protein PilF
MEDCRKDFFISYTSTDVDWATWVAAVLEKNGYSTIIQAWDFVPGTNFVQSMQKATVNCDRTIAILSKKYFESLFTQSEWQAAFAQDPTSEKSKLIPIRISDFEPIGLLKQIIYIDLFDIDEEMAKSKLLVGIDLSRRARNSQGFPGTKKKINSGELPFNNINIRRNKNFTGRTGFLNEIKNEFNQINNHGLCQILTGFGGVGKSQIALEYIYANGYEYDFIWWIEAEDSKVIIDGYRDFTYKMGFVEGNVEDSEIIMSSINSWTSQNKKWLFIFDNAENAELIYNYLPINPQGHIIITSRNINWGALGSVLEIDVFNEIEASAFLRKRTNLQVESGMNELLLDLGRLPLALEQASSYILNNGISYNDYNTLFNKYRIEILKKYPPLKYNQSVATTWKISIDKINDESSRQLLNILAFLYAESVDIRFFTILAEHLDSPLSDKIGNILDFNDIIYKLKEYSLIKYSSNTISIHRLLQEVIQLDTDIGKWVSVLVNLAYEHLDFDIEDSKSWIPYKEIINQICSIVNHGYRHKIEMVRVSYLFHQLGSFFNLVLNDFKQAESMFLEAVKIREEVFGVYSKKTIITKNNLAGLYKDEGRYRESEILYLELISECGETFADNRELLLILKDNLGQLYQVSGNIDEARKIYDEVVEEKVNYYGSDSQFTAVTMGNYAVLLTQMGEYVDAENLLVKSLKIVSDSIGTQNQQIASILDALANVYTKLCRYDLAEKYFQDSLQVRKSIFGSEHSDIATSLNNLAILYMELYRFHDAEKLLYESLEISEKIISIDPCELASTYNNLGMALYGQEKYEVGETMLVKALDLRKKYLGENHIDFSASYTNLGNLYTKLKVYDSAEYFLKEALNIRKKVLGIKHPDTISAINNLGILYDAQKKFDLAEPLLVQALNLTKEILGDEHKDSIESYFSLSVFYLQTKRAEKGVKLLFKAIELSKKVLGDKHETTIMINDYFQKSVLPRVKIVY